MKLIPLRIIAFSFGSALILAGCSKTNDNNSIPKRQNDLHVYGLNPMQPSDWANVPLFSREVINGYRQSQGIPGIATLPGNYLLISPNVRDQGQIGSCTGFCGTETNEMVEYENSTPSSTTVTYANGASTAIGYQIPNTSQTNNSSALSPLFLYYVERVVINKGSISSDPGANMMNIGQALQGLTNNTGTGVQLTTSTKVKGKTITSSPYAGECIETDYAYPWVNGSNGFNVASPSSSSYLTAPNSTAISNAFNYDILTNPANSATSTGSTTTGGYYVINSSSIINDVKTAIASNLPVMMGFQVYDDKNSASATYHKYFEGLNTTNYVYNPLNASGSVISGLSLMGGHAVPIIGYIADDPGIPSSYGGGVFIVENSWGTPWGDQGYFYLPFNVLTSTTIVPSGSLYVIVK
jgi:hypothetical protein